MNRRAFVALAAGGFLPPPSAGAAPPDHDGWPDADPASWPGYEPVGGSAAVIAVVLTWSLRRPPAYRIDFLDLEAPMAPGIVLRGPLDPSGLQIASHVPYGTAVFPTGPGNPEHTTLVIDFGDPAAVSVYATPATPRGIAIVARPAACGASAAGADASLR
jgi:hypothetical protein